MKKHSPSTQKPNTVGSITLMEKRKKFSQNASSMNFFSPNCLAPFRDVHTLDIKHLTHESVVNILNTLLKINTNTHSTYIGPLGINKWILENLAKETIASDKLLAFLHTKNRLHPYSFYNLYQFILEFLNYSSAVLKVNSSKITDEILDQKDLFISFAKLGYLGKNKLKLLNNLCNLFIPELDIFDHIDIPYVKTKNLTLNHETINAYLHSARKNGIKEVTIRKNQGHYQIFLVWLKEVFSEFNSFNLNFIPLFRVASEHLLEFRNHLIRKVQREEISERYASDIFYTIRALFAQLYQMKLLNRDITVQATGIEFDKYVYRDIPSDLEINRLLDISDMYSPNPQLYRTAFYLTLLMGFRPQEVCSLYWEDINLETGKIAVVGKGKPSLLPLPTALRQQFEKLPSKNQKGPVFTENPSYFKNELYHYYKLFALMAGWTYPGGLYLLRHTFITRLSERVEYPPQVIMYLARHERTESTSLYIHRKEQILRKAINSLNYKGKEHD